MALTDQQRAELERLGLSNVLVKLAQPGTGRGAALGGFPSGDMTRGDVEDWTGEKLADQARQQAEALRWTKISGKWARIAGWAALAAVGIGIVVPLLQWLLAK
jgi:hypothetical protein